MKNAIDERIENFTKYRENDGKKVIIISDLSVGFLRYLNVKYLYLDKGFKDKEIIDEINKLMTAIYSLDSFIKFFRKNLQDYNQRIIHLEDKYLFYKKLLHSFYFKLCYKKTIISDKNKYLFSADDEFMIKYSILRNTFLTENEGNIDREKLINGFMEPLKSISADYLSIDYDAIEINDICNEAISNYNQIKALKEKHLKQIGSYITLLKNINKNIDKYLKE